MIHSIALDCDGPLTPYKDEVIKAVTRGRLDPKQVTKYELREYLTLEENDAYSRLMKDPDWWRALPVVEGAKDAVARMRTSGIEIIVATSPWEQCIGWESARRAWLFEHFEIKKDQVLVGSAKEWIGTDGLVEDYIENLRKWKRRNPTKQAFVWDASYTREPIDFSHTRLDGWSSWPVFHPTPR